MKDSEKPKNSTGSSYSTKPQPIINMEALKSRAQSAARRRPPRRAAALFLAILICFLAGFGGGWLGGWLENHGKTAVATSTAAKQQYISNESQLIESIAKNVGQSVVSVNVTGQSTTSV